ncbi:protein of unknown function [Chitinophaga jiangningensis]|uniref:DUF4381 domain-containing protein n=1 Tax=Chitinophaga jiangningensis TaxID=1419482 RepID=A0A1M7LMK3_9BACT|nr:DUF4381 domain-containing protein [Chitinophaga jiangningensis]SHM79402.1 protein of unknown function [Chitinophaga jiangningensis]
MAQPGNDIGQLIVPDPVPFTFAAPGWYVAGVLLLLLLVTAVFLLVRRYRRNRYRRHALAWLEAKQQAQLTPAQLLFDTDMLLKQIAMHRYGAATVASLQQQPWMDFLNNSSRPAPGFTAEDAGLLQVSLYKPGAEPIAPENINQFITKAKSWIRHHKHAPGNSI